MNKLILLTVLTLGLVGCGDSPRSNSLMCFLKEGFVNCHDREIDAMLPEPIPGPKGDVGETGPMGEVGPMGPQGEAGIDGKDGSTVLVVFPCGEDSVRHAEILLLIDGQYIAYFQNIIKVGSGNGQPVKDVEARLTVLEEGTNYMLTDGSKCKFHILNGEVVEGLL